MSTVQYHLAEIFRNPVKNQNLAYFTAIRKLDLFFSSTVSGKNVTLNQFNSMQRLREQPELTDMSKDEVCSVFARYVTETATTPKDQKEKLLMRDTCTQYVSGVKNLAFARFPKNEIWSTERLWYTKLRSVIAAAVNRRQILLGESVQEKSDAVDRTLLASIMKSMTKVRHLG